MAQFAAQQSACLLRRIVVEDGVDVPAAYHHGDRECERFGSRNCVAARQDRPRLGGVDLPAPLQAAARRDVEGAAESGPETTHGFRIAEEDLKLRGKATSSASGKRPARLPHRAPRGARQLIAQARDKGAARCVKDNPNSGVTAAKRCAACSLFVRARDEAVPDWGRISVVPTVIESVTKQPSLREERMDCFAVALLLAMTWQYPRR